MDMLTHTPEDIISLIMQFLWAVWLRLSVSWLFDVGPIAKLIMKSLFILGDSFPILAMLSTLYCKNTDVSEYTVALSSCCCYCCCCCFNELVIPTSCLG